MIGFSCFNCSFIGCLVVTNSALFPESLSDAVRATNMLFNLTVEIT